MTGKRTVLVLLALAVVACTAVGGEKKHVLIFGMTKGFRHKAAIEKGSPILKQIAEKLGYQATISEDPAVFDPDQATQWDLIIYNNCTGRLNPEEEPRRNALMARIKEGAGFMGFHSATDCNYNWPEYGQMINGYFSGHPWNQEVHSRIEDPDHPLMKPFKGGPFVIRDEIYQFRNYTRSNVRVLMSINTRSVDVSRGRRDDRDYAICWIRPWGKGRVYYNAHGHGSNVFENTTFQEHVGLAMQWAIGDLEADTTPSKELDLGALAEKALASLAGAATDEARLEALDVLSYCPHPKALDAIVPLLGHNQLVASAAADTLAGLLARDKEMAKERRLEILKAAYPCARNRATWKSLRDQLTALGAAVPDTVPPGYIAHWWLAGTMRNRKDEMLDTMYTPETGVDLAKPFKAGGRNYRWKKILAHPEGLVDLLVEFGRRNNAGAYLYAEITVDDPADAQLLVGSDESFVAWVNGKEVGRFAGRRKFKPGTDKLDVSLDLGVNKILLKSLQGGGEWVVAAQLVGDDGKPLTFTQRKK